jgi:AAA+ superfamily predicted ATPase
MDGFDSLGQTKIIMATNRPDTLDPALLRPGRLDRKIEIPLPNEQGRLEILKIHAAPIAKMGEIDYEAVVKLSDGFNGADLRNICTEAGMFAIREERDYCTQDDFMKVCLLRLGLASSFGECLTRTLYRDRLCAKLPRPRSSSLLSTPSYRVTKAVSND